MSRSTLSALAVLMLVPVLITLLVRAGAGPAAEPVTPAAAVASDTAPAYATPSLPRTPAVQEAAALLAEGRPWRAARRLREGLGARLDAAPPAVVLLAARAEAGWGGWERVRALLEGRDWLDREHGGEAWFWLARAREEAGVSGAAGAAAAYGRYLTTPDAAAHAERRRVAALRHGLLVLRSAGDDARGAGALEAVRGAAPGLAPWVDLLAAEALAPHGDTARVRQLAADRERGELGVRARRVRLEAYRAAGDATSTRALALVYRAAATGSERADLSLAAAEAAEKAGDGAAARADLLVALAAAPGSRAGLDAARRLDAAGGLSAADRLAIAGAYARHGQSREAAAHYRSWLASGAGTAEQRRGVQLDLGRALFAAGEHAAAETALAPLPTAEAGLLRGRAQYRRGQSARGRETLLAVAERFPGSATGGEALFIVADLAHDAGETARARELYRRAAHDFSGDRAGLSAMRLAGMAYLAREYAGAAAEWERYRERYPTGQRWLEATYWAGRAYEAQRDTARAHARYREALAREPISYYALRAGERLGVPFRLAVAAAAPAADTAAARVAAERLLASDVLRGAGLYAEAEAEADRVIAAAGTDTRLLYPLAEALIERGYAIRGIRLGLAMRERGEPQNERLLRIVYPFPYRAMVTAEAEEKGLDPFLTAALIRQESMFEARIASPAGARGLMQIMPETGRPLARAAGIEGWDAELLYQPEINAHLGTRYLAEQMKSYDGSLPAVFSAYNAGPHRVTQWKRFPEYGTDEELFTERIPYRETRDYVKILTRNRAIYRALYAG